MSARVYCAKENASIFRAALVQSRAPNKNPQVKLGDCGAEDEVPTHTPLGMPPLYKSIINSIKYVVFC